MGEEDNRFDHHLLLYCPGALREALVRDEFASKYEHLFYARNGLMPHYRLLQCSR